MRVAGVVAVMAMMAVVVIGCGDDDGGNDGNHTHTWGDWVVTTPENCDAEGVQTRTCIEDASHKETRAIPQLVGGQCNGINDGYTYIGGTVEIGGLTWMAENLNRATSNSWCYDDDPSNCDKYGRLYTWDAAMTVCPAAAGWRLPDTADWNKLVTAAGGWEVAGSKLKSTSGWRDNGNGTDEFGFSALPGGYRDDVGYFGGTGILGEWWSATEYGSGDAYQLYMGSGFDGVAEPNDYDKSFRLSVRCVRD